MFFFIILCGGVLMAATKLNCMAPKSRRAGNFQGMFASPRRFRGRFHVGPHEIDADDFMIHFENEKFFLRRDIVGQRIGLDPYRGAADRFFRRE